MNHSPKPQGWKERVSRPLPLFVWLTGVNALLSWAPLTMVWRLELFFLGILLPLGLFFVRPAFRGREPAAEEKVLFPFPAWLAVALLLGALGIRFFALGTLPVWPQMDEGASFLFAERLFRQWQPNHFFDYNFLPPLYFWLLALVFKAFSPSLASLWLLPAVLSWAGLLAGYAACRSFFTRSLSNLWLVAWAFGFWPLYAYRFSVPPVLVPLWECLCLALLGSCLRAENPRAPWLRWMLLGIGIGTGFYTFFNWPLVALALLVPVYYSTRPSLKPGFPIWVVSICAFAVAAPQLVAFRLAPHPPFLMNAGVFRDLDPVRYLTLAGSYITALFWGPDASLAYHAYKPFWGGFLNPLMDSLFFMGAVEVARDFKTNRLCQWLVFAFFLFLTPVFLAKNLEMFRVIELLPLLLLVAVLGLQRVLGTWEGKGRILFLCAFWACSSGIDLYHLTVRYPDLVRKMPPELWDGYGFQRPCFEAYQILNRYAAVEGPGIVLNNFTAPLETDPKEQSLTAACYPFDAGRNGKYGGIEARWAAVLVENPDARFLKQRFPEARWYDLGPSLYANSTWYSAIRYSTPTHRYFMMVEALGQANREIFRKWARANLFIQDILYQGLNPTDPGFRSTIADNLLNNHGLFQGDPFLEGHFWILVQENLWAGGKPRDQLIVAVREGLKSGYPYAEKYHLLGNLLYQSGEYPQALAAFKRAGALNPELKAPAAFIQRLEHLE